MKTYHRLTPKLALQLAAPHTWAASVCPSVFAVLYCAAAGLHLNPVQIVCLPAACVLLQSAVNTLNDYADYRKGTDSEEDNVEVSDAVLVYSGIDPKHALFLGIGYLLAGVILGILASVYAGFTPILIGVVGALTVLLYSGGPMPVSYLPVGEIVSGLVMGGLIPLGTAACADNRLHPEILLWALPFIIGIGLIMMSNNGCDIEKDIAITGIGLIMMSNNGCDIEKDITAGRHTLPVYLGRKRTQHLYHDLLLVWVFLLSMLPAALLGWAGLVSPALILTVGRKPFVWLLGSSLRPEKRIRQMKMIAAANLFGNGAYIAALAVGLIIRQIAGI